MKKVLIGLVAAAIAAAGFFGFAFYAQHRIDGEVEAAFDRLRANGTKATHGRVTFDLWSRTVAIADISAELAAQQPVSVKIGRVTTSGVSQPEAGSFSAKTIVAADIEIGGAMGAPAGWNVRYRVPQLEIADYSGPAGPLRQIDSSSAPDVLRFVYEHLAAVTASSIVAPSVTMTLNTSDAPIAGTSDYTYSGLALRGIKGGKIATMSTERINFTTTLPQGGKAEKLTGEIAGISSYDFDSAAVAAMFDPARAKDAEYYRVYRQIKLGAYTLSTEDRGMVLRVGGATIDDMALRPSRLQIPALLASLPPAGAVPTAAQTRQLFELMAGFYEGLRVGNAELRDLSAETPQGGFKLAAIRFNLENGKVGEFAIEGLDGRLPQGPVKVGRFALKGFDIAGFMRQTLQLATLGPDRATGQVSGPVRIAPSPSPSSERLLAFLPVLEGIEVKSFSGPYKASTKPVTIEDFSLNWGGFVGPIPSKAHLTLKMSAPIDPTDELLQMLRAAGIESQAMSADLGATWNEDARTFALDPMTVELGGLLSATAHLSLGNVPREMFSTNLLQAAAVGSQVSAGSLDITVRDLGVVELATARFASPQNASGDAARRAIADNVRTQGAAMAEVNPDAMAIAAAIASFIENPRGTLTLKLTPKGNVPMMQFVQMLKLNPLAALASFQVDARIGR